MDRIDLKVHVSPVPMSERLSLKGEPTETIRRRVAAAMDKQRKRYDGLGFSSNADVPGSKILSLFQFSASSLAIWQKLVEDGNLSMRSADRMAKVARTIADLEQCDGVSPEHLMEAAEFVTGL